VINGVLTLGGACGGYYDVFNNILYINQDNGGAWVSPRTLGQAGTIENSHCAIDTGASSVMKSGNTLTLNLAISFKAGFGGTKTIYMNVGDQWGLASDWQSRGTWTPMSVAPTAVSVTPSSGSGASQTFALQYADGNGAGDISQTMVVINGVLTLGGACGGYYDVFNNILYINQDNGGAWVSPHALGQAGTIENSQCIIDTGASSVLKSGNTLTLNLAVSFKTGFVGTKTVYMNVGDQWGLGSGWQSRGTWIVP